ncbi:response regulator [Shewanella sp.]|uniref:response regulator n=1 Tax=Shewanella sp. TaxID=50422 RepID=UPI003A976559
MTQQAYDNITIFLIDDDDVDFMAVKRSMTQLGLRNPLVRARDGLEALDMLNNQHVQAPYLILLDLNMPRMNGLEFLEHIRDDDEFSMAVVFVLTTSAADDDKFAAYSHHVAGYIVKNSLRNGFVNLFDMLQQYCSVVELPYQ